MDDTTTARNIAQQCGTVQTQANRILRALEAARNDQRRKDAETAKQYEPSMYTSSWEHVRAGIAEAIENGITVCGVANPGGTPCTKNKGHRGGHDPEAYGPNHHMFEHFKAGVGHP